jgi:tRNA pseudouridine38-40 synthase
VLGRALERYLGAAPRIVGAGRTDAGVHARGQVASFEAPAGTDPARLQRALNGMLGPEVVVTSARSAPEGFSARHSATGRSYRYVIDTGEWPDPFGYRYVWHRPGPLAVGPMRRAARDLVGTHDFTSFCRLRKGEGPPVRTLRRLSVAKRGSLVVISAEADGFLHQMVRSVVGTLVDVAVGRRDPGSMGAILAARDRHAAGRMAPPSGLCLERVRYGR